MAFKWFAMIIGALWWAFGAMLDFSIAFGSGGAIAFAVVLVLGFYFLYHIGFHKNKAVLDLWIWIFRGLSIEALVFSAAILVLGWTMPEVMGPGATWKDVFVDYGIPGVVIALLFWFNAWLFDRHLRTMFEQLEESKRLRLEQEELLRKSASQERADTTGESAKARKNKKREKKEAEL